MLYTCVYTYTYERICVLEKCKLASMHIEESRGKVIYHCNRDKTKVPYFQDL